MVDTSKPYPLHPQPNPTLPQSISSSPYPTLDPWDPPYPRERERALPLPGNTPRQKREGRMQWLHPTAAEWRQLNAYMHAQVHIFCMQNAMNHQNQHCTIYLFILDILSNLFKVYKKNMELLQRTFPVSPKRLLVLLFWTMITCVSLRIYLPFVAMK